VTEGVFFVQAEVGVGVGVGVGDGAVEDPKLQFRVGLVLLQSPITRSVQEAVEPPEGITHFWVPDC